MPRPQPLPEPLGLRVETDVVGNTTTEDAFDHEVHREQVGQRIPMQWSAGGLRQQRARSNSTSRVEAASRTVPGPVPTHRYSRYHLVTRPGTGDDAERNPPRRTPIRHGGKYSRPAIGSRPTPQRTGSMSSTTPRRESDLMLHRGVDVSRFETPAGRTISRRRGHRETRKEARRADGGGRERPPDKRRIGVPHDAAQQSTGLFRWVRRLIEPRQRPLHRRRTLGQRCFELFGEQCRLASTSRPVSTTLILIAQSGKKLSGPSPFLAVPLTPNPAHRHLIWRPPGSARSCPGGW